MPILHELHAATNVGGYDVRGVPRKTPNDVGALEYVEARQSRV